MSVWKEKRLDELCSFISRGITPQYVEAGLPVINQKCIRDNRVNLNLCRFTNASQKIDSRKHIRYGDILINSTGTGTLGRVAIFRENVSPITADGHVTILHVKEGTSSIYLGYYLHSVEKIIENFGRGSTNQLELSVSDLSRIKIMTPDLPTQNRIADILSTYDDLIENNSRRIALLEQAAQELYKEWFVRFRFPGYENTKFENGLPTGWVIRRLEFFGEIETGKTPSMAISENYGNDFLFIKTPDMHGNVFVIETEEMLSSRGNDSQPKKLIPANSIMVTCIGTGGIVAINAESAHTNQQINSIIPRNNTDVEWLFFTCKALKPTIELFGATGTTMTNLSKGKFSKLKVLDPGDNLRELYHTASFPMLKLIKTLMYQNRDLIHQRDLLLPRLMNGQWEV